MHTAENENDYKDARLVLTGLESSGRPVQGWKALVAVASNEWRFCFFQLLQGRRGEGL